MSSLPPVLPLLCEAAARALGGAATLELPGSPAPLTWGPDAPGAERLTVEGRDGARLHVHRPAGAAPWSDDDRALAAVFARLLDETGGRAVHDALRAGEERYRSLVENAHDMIVVIDPATGRLTYQSPSMERILGYPPEALAGGDAFALVHPDDAERARHEIAQAVARPGVTRHAEYRYRHADGSWRHLETYGRTLSPTSPAEGVVLNTRDVTERQQTEEALRASESRYRSLVEQLPAVIYTASLAEGNPTLFVSPQVERLLGIAGEEWLTRPRLWLERVHADDRERVERDWDAAHAAGRRFAAEYRMVTRDGRVRWFRDEAVVQRDAAGRPLYIQGVMVDVTDRKAAEAALRESEDHFRRMIENGSDLLLISAPDGRLTYASPSAERVLGWTPHEMLAARPEALLHPDDLAHVLDSMRGAAEVPNVIRQVDFRVRHRDGGWRRFEALARALSPDAPEAGVVCNARDVTEQRAAEEALQRSEKHFRALIENGSDLLMISAPDGTLSYVSPSAQRLLGYRPEEMMGTGPGDLVHPDDLPMLWANMRRIMDAPGTVGETTWRIRHRDGSWRLIDAFGRTVNSESADDGIVINGRDVTEQRAAERALQESEAKYRSLIENGSDLLMIAAPDLALTYVSPSAERLLGYRPEELVGRRPDDLLHPDDTCALEENVRRVLADPEFVTRATWRIRHRNGAWRLFEALGRSLAPGDGTAGFIVNARDITDRVAAEDALRQAKADAEQAHQDAERANRAKSEFLSRMSHELRTPLNSILGFAQVLEDVELLPEYRMGVRHILNGGRHLLNLINEVLDIARIEAGQQPLSLEPVRVQTVVREAIDMIRPLAAARGVQVVDAGGGCATRYVRADRQRLAQVLLNLLSNAVKYNRPGGEVRIDVLLRDADGERVRVRVRDEGLGLTPEQQAQLFVPFARLGAERTGVEGTGLGLALSQRLAQAMGGALFLERSGADGSVFAVELPTTPDPLADSVALSGAWDRAGDAARTPATLLYIEDNLANLTLVETVLLPRPEWRVIPALQGRLGIELALEHAPDVILLDLHLPDMHGAEVLRHLRADARTARTPVVVISADATARAIGTLTAEGADAFLTKPLDVRAFVQTVERLVALGASR